MSKTLNEAITEDLKAAMRDKNTVALTVLRGLKSALKYAAIEKGGAEGELDETEALAVVRKQIKQRQDSVESFKSAGRDDLVEKEEAETKILEAFLPAGLSDAEIGELADSAIAELGATSKKEMGAVMKRLQELAAGRADNRALSSAVAQRLS